MPLWAVVRCAKAGTLHRQSAAIGGMNMANRNDSEVHQHETLPGPGPGKSSYIETATGGGRPVEQMMDAAIERIAREQRLATSNSLSPLSPIEAGVFDAAIERPAKPTRLRWKGLDVSDEFRSYAERVARGEELPPFEGRVLAEPNAAFPWGPMDHGVHPGIHGVNAAGVNAAGVNAASRAARAALWCSAAVVLGLLTWSVALEFQASRERDLLPPLAVPSEAASSDAVPHDVVETPSRVASGNASGNTSGNIDERVAEHLAIEKPLDLEAVVSRAVPAAPTGVAATVAPLASATTLEPAAAPLAAASPVIPALSPLPSAPPVVAAPAAPAPVAAAAAVSAPKAASPAPAPAAPAAPELDFGIDAASASASAPLKSSVTMMGSVGDLSRSGQVPGASVRKEPGSESSAKGSLLVENPSF